MKDITRKEDIVLLIDLFYEQAILDKEIGHFFSNVDWDYHKPRMHAFWEYILLDKPAKIHSVFDTHAKLNIKPVHFGAWLKHFNHTIDQNFEGPKANLAKQRALVIAHTFNSKMNPNTELDLSF